MNKYKCGGGRGKRVPHFFRSFRFPLPERPGGRARGLFTPKFNQESHAYNIIVPTDVLRDIVTYMVERVIDLINYDVLYI